ncbi:hypothetical protein BC828DRAFT_377508 [Blastocladiella britannica]|nr:hypothetical protein BC828DRAFT_377508 [Blastocladiella britannica]
MVVLLLLLLLVHHLQLLLVLLHQLVHHLLPERRRTLLELLELLGRRSETSGRGRRCNHTWVRSRRRARGWLLRRRTRRRRVKPMMSSDGGRSGERCCPRTGTGTRSRTDATARYGCASLGKVAHQIHVAEHWAISGRAARQMRCMAMVRKAC